MTEAGKSGMNWDGSSMTELNGGSLSAPRLHAHDMGDSRNLKGLTMKMMTNLI